MTRTKYFFANWISKYPYKGDDRNSSIELLRILSMIGIIILHYNNAGIGIASNDKMGGSANLYYLYFTTSIFVCSVDLFMMISAYYLSTTNQRKLIKVVELLIQIIVFRCGFYIISIIIGNTHFTIIDFLRSILPINYFVIFWSVIYILSPYYNILIENLQRKQFKKFVILLFLIFSVWNTLVDLLENITKSSLNGLGTVGFFGNQSGYTIVNFSVVYFIGAYIQKNNIKLSQKKAVFGIISTLSLIYISVILEHMEYGKGSQSYYHPFVIIISVFILLLFFNIEFHNRIINELARGAFTCFLCQVKITENLHLENIANQNVFILGIHQFGLAITIYILSYVVFKIYYLCSHWFIKLLIPLCNKINISI